MKPSERKSVGGYLLRQREVLRRNFIRANSAVAVILFALLALAVAAVVASLRASHSQELAEAAGRERQAQLADSLRAQARALRLGGQVGRRFDALVAISNAAVLGPSSELRSEAIACLALTDLATERCWPQIVDAPFLAFDKQLKRCAICPDGRHINLMGTTTNTKSLQLDLETLPLGEKRRSAGFVFSPDGRYLAARLYGGGAVVWETGSGQVAFNSSTNGEFSTGGTPSFTKDGQRLVFCEARSGTNLMQVNLQTSRVECLPVSTGPSRLFMVHPQGRRVAVANRNAVEIWNLETGELERRLEFAGRVSALDWSDNGHILAAGSTDGDVNVWDLDSGSIRQLNGHRASIVRVLFSPDGEQVCTVGEDGNSRIWDALSGRALLTMEGQALQFSEDGQCLAACRTWKNIFAQRPNSQQLPFLLIS